MKVVAEVEEGQDILLIVAETDFEEDYLRRFHCEKNLTVFLKHGMTIETVIGLKIINKNISEKN
jgi:hypothetical protein